MRRFIASLYYIKACELEDMRQRAKLLRGLNFATAYTPHFGMCNDSLSEIMQADGVRVTETKSTLRFCCSNLSAAAELESMRRKMNDFCREAPETADLWQEVQPEYYAKALAKSKEALRKTFKEIGCKSGDHFDVLVMNNDRLPMLELSVSKEFESLIIAKPGDIIEFRFEVILKMPSSIHWRLLLAHNYR